MLKDTWSSGNPYDYFMGRWSTLVARSFIHWLQPGPGSSWLDMGCGSGALSQAILNDCQASHITAIDQSEGFINMAQGRLGGAVDCKVGDAFALPLSDNAVDFSVSGLVLNFISDPVKALSEMKRVTVEGGTVAVYIWDYAGTMEFLNHFWDVAGKLNPNALTLHEGIRFPDANEQGLSGQFQAAGLNNTTSKLIEISTHFPNFNDYWNPFLGGQGPAPSYVLSLLDNERAALKNALREQLLIQADGSISMTAKARAMRASA
jgi:SAM-dependent methyltransferase